MIKKKLSVKERGAGETLVVVIALSNRPSPAKQKIRVGFEYLTLV
jgi:hypothetical protein